MTVEQLFAMSPEEIRDNFSEAVQCIRDNRENKSGGLPYVWHDYDQITWEITQIKKRSARPRGFEVDTDGTISHTGFDRNFCL